MKNCGGDPNKLQELVENIAKHYQVPLSVSAQVLCEYDLCELFLGVHTKCPESSPYLMPKYNPSKTMLTDPRTIQKLEEQLVQQVACPKHSRAGPCPLLPAASLARKLQSHHMTFLYYVS